MQINGGLRRPSPTTGVFAIGSVTIFICVGIMLAQRQVQVGSGLAAVSKYASTPTHTLGSRRSPVGHVLAGRMSKRRTPCKNYKDDSEISLMGLSDIQGDAKYLKETIRLGLDQEWVEQAVHGTIGSEVERLYIKFREEGINDVTLMMLEIGGVLSDRKQFDMGDAFVNGWDVANMVGDILIKKIADGEGGISDVVVIDQQ
eukprot:jgi/Bigna1/90706/estExt_fgenesh1_pg.C_770028